VGSVLAVASFLNCSIALVPKHCICEARRAEKTMNCNFESIVIGKKETENLQLMDQ
jgi:hypothetical protein